MMSFWPVKASWTSEEEVMTTTRREPKRRENIGPYLLEKLWRRRWIGGFKRWRWPTTGRDGGPGGRLKRSVSEKMNL